MPNDLALLSKRIKRENRKTAYFGNTLRARLIFKVA
jgi:hypothetical protein